MKWISFCQERLCSRRFEMLACLTACLWEELCVTTQTILGFHMTSQKFKLRFYFGGYSIYPWVGRCGPAPHTLTLFKTKIADFPTLFKTQFRFLIRCLRHS